LLFNQATREFFVNGVTFAEDDDAMILQAEQLFDKPSVGRPEGAGWVEVTPETYAQLSNQIRNPSLGRLFSKNFGIGVDQLQQLAGYGLQLAGAEELGGRIVEAQVGSEDGLVRGDLQKSAPYQRQFTDIGSAGEGFEWFVANLAQQGPNLLESIGVAALGAAAGTAAAGPLGGAAGTIAGFVGKKAFKDQVKKAAKEYTEAKAKGVAPSDAVVKTLKNAAAVSGAVAASVASNYATGAADIYGEIREQGADADDVMARMTALAGAIPYAALESTSEYLLASRIFGNALRPRPLTAGASRTRQGLQLAGRGLTGFGVGAVSEGLTELGQEGLVMGLSGQDLTSDEAVNRFINSFAAGAAVGGAIGGVANLKRGKKVGETGTTGDQETNLLDSSSTSRDFVMIPPPQLGYTPTPTGTSVVPFTTPVTPMGAVPPAPLQLPAPPTAPVTPVGEPAIMVTPEGVAYPDQMLRQTGNVPPSAPGTQGVLDIFGGTISAQELASRMQPQVATETSALPAPPPGAAPGQLALQFAPPAPEPATGTMANRLQQLQQQAQRQREFELAEQQRMQQEAAVREQQINMMERQRQLQLAEEPAAPPVAPPTRPVPLRQPQQLPLFPPSELPRPSRGEALRRGVAGAGLPPLTREPTGLVTTELDEQGRPRVVQTAVPPLTAQEARRAGQLPLFTQEGQPSTAALKAAGARGPVSKPTPQKGAKQAPPTGRKVTPESKRKAQEEQRKKEEAKNELVRKGQLVQAGRQWPKFTDAKTQPKWSELTDDQKEQWRLAFAEKRMSAAESERIAPPKKEKPDAVSKPSTKKVLTRGGTKAGAKVGEEVPSKGKAAGKGEDLKKGKPKQEAVVTPAAPTASTERDYAEQVLQRYDALTEAQRDAVAQELGLTRAELIESEAIFERTEEVDDAIAAVRRRPAKTTPVEEPFTPKSFAELEAAAAAQRPLRTERAVEPTITPMEAVNEAIADADVPANDKAFSDAIEILAIQGFTVTDETSVVAANKKARNYLVITDFSDRQGTVNDIVVAAINKKGSIEVARKDEGEIKYKDTYKFLIDNNLLSKLNATVSGLPTETAAQLVRDGQLSLTNLPDSKAKEVIAANPDLVEQEANNLARGQGDSVQDNAGIQLAAIIRDINKSPAPLTPAVRASRIAGVQEMWDKLPDEYRDFVDETGTPLSDYFTDDVVNSTVVNKKVRITKRVYTEEQVATFEVDEMAQPDPELQRLEREERGRSEESWNAWNEKLRDGNFSRAEGGRITQPLPLLRIRTAINKFLGKLAIKPRVYVYKDQADLKAKNPRLHQRAAESRPEGDFDSTPAVGFAFGNGEVIIFSDYIATEQQLNFVLAHETIGHFGMRGLIPAKQFDALMQKIYDDNPGIRGDIDAKMAVDNMSLAEATEEYLADFAAQLDTSVIARVWNAIKGVLNKLGVQFGDETARYFVSHARKYVRNGKVGVPFQIRKVFERMHDVEYGQIPANPGRFATQGNVYEVGKKAVEIQNALGGLPESFDAAWEKLKGLGVDSLGSYERFKSKFLSLANFRSLQNPGANAMENLIEQMRNRSMSIKVDMNERLRTVLNRAVYGEIGGVSEEQLTNLSDALYAAQRLSIERFDITKERGKNPLFTMVDGVLELNPTEYDRLRSTGRITFEQMRDGFDYDVLALEDGKEVTKKERFKGVPGLTRDSIEWTGYEKIRDAIDDVEIQLAKAHYYSNIAKQDTAFSEIGEFMEGKELTGDDRAMLRRALDTYNRLYTENSSIDERGTIEFDEKAMERGNDFLVKFNQAIIGEATDRTDTLVKEFFTGKIADDMRNRINDFKTRFRKEAAGDFEVQNKIKQLLTDNRLNEDAELYAKRTIATGYTPLLREGNYQTRIEAVDPATGKRVQLSEASRDQLVYSQFDKESEAIEFKNKINKIFGDDTYKLDVFNESTGVYGVQDVKLVAVAETVLDEVAAPPELNLNEFVMGLRHFNLAVPPKKLEEIITALTAQNSSARNRLSRAFVPGANRDAIAAVSRHIERRASTIAKVQLRPAMAELLNLKLSRTQRLWNGDSELLERLKQNADAVAADPTATDEQKGLAKQEYIRYKYMYDTTNPKGRAEKGMEFYNEASRTAAFLDGNRNVDESDFGSGKLVSGIRAGTSMIQLGASVATGVLNIIGAYTNGLPYLASRNQKTGFGGGFGLGPAVAEFHIALKEVGGIGMNPFSETSRAANRAEFYDQIATDPRLQAQYNLKAHEARFIAREIREGTMIPAQSNALVGSSRGRATSGAMQKFIDGWMLTFNLTEQATRRSYGLAAYRLEYKRQKGAGATDAQAEAAARKSAVAAIQLTMGEYSVLNRPPAWRSGIQSFIYMYKVFPTTSVQLLANLSRNGQIGMLAGLFLLSGLMGLPFAEDIEDIVDTIAQKLGFKQGSIRFEIAKFIDGIFPGMSPYVLGGFVRDAFPGNIASRTSLGNLFPGTGMFLSGADTSRELMDIAGPAASAITGTVKTFSDAVRAPFSDQISALGVVRESPVTIARAFGDAYAYAQSGSIIDRRGYMVSDDMTIGTIVSRILGFYPTAASDQYSMIKISKRMTDYQRDTTTAFRSAWINAMQTGDRQRARSIEESVDAWNKEARGTALEIRNFRANSMKALREAQRPAGERALKAAPRAAREDVERLSNLLGN
jgi:hypothetical protein